MRQVTRSALVAQPPSRMFALITDVERYPEFVPGCSHVRIESRMPNGVVATLGVRKGPLQAEFTTRTTYVPDRHITIELIRGSMFKELHGEWHLTPIGADGCRIEYSMRFAFANRMSALLLEPVFEQTATSLVDAFIARARSGEGR